MWRESVCANVERECVCCTLTDGSNLLNGGSKVSTTLNLLGMIGCESNTLTQKFV